MGWSGHLALRYRREGARTVVHDRHDGPLRVLKSLRPEGDAVCHSVLVHPPGGIVGGDSLEIDVDIEAGAHALITSPGATRFYRSIGDDAVQDVTVHAAGGARIEWLPLETIAFSGCLATNRARFLLDDGAESIGWDLTALGLPASDQPFVAGRYTQSIELPGRWLERGTVRGDDHGLLGSPLGWAGHRVLGTVWFAVGGALATARAEALLGLARDAAAAHPLAASSGATAVDGAVVLRVLSPRVEPAMALLTAVWSAWRMAAWQLPACPPRTWRT